MKFLFSKIAGMVLLLAALVPRSHAESPPATSGPSLSAAPAIQIAFRSESVVRGENYTLGDVAVITGADPVEKKRIESAVIGRSPCLGTQVPLNARFLALQLERRGIEGARVSLHFSDRMVVRRASQDVDMAALRRAIEKELRDHLPANQADTVVENIQLPSAIQLPAGELAYRIGFRLPSRDVGSAAFTVDLIVDGVQRHRVSGTLRLDRKVEALRLASGVDRGDLIRDSMCETTPVLLSALRGKPLLAKDLEANPTAKRDLSPGDALTWSNVEKQQLVRRGQTVRMVLESASGMRISTLGQARANGALGDLVEVVNVSSGKKVQGVVAGEQIVRVSF